MATGSGLAKRVFSSGLERLDAWANALTGMGETAFDSMRSARARPDTLTQQAAEDTFRGSWLGRKICTKPPADAMRAWCSLVIEADEGDEKARSEAPGIAADVMDELRRLNARRVFREAATFARQRGGCLVFIGAQDNKSPDEPLDLAAVESVDFLTVFERDWAYPESTYDNPDEPRYGEVEAYRIARPHVGAYYQPGGAGGATIIHESRLLWFRGEVTTPSQRHANQGWDDSVFEPIFDVLQRNAQAWQAVGHLLNKSNVLAFKITDFVGMLTQQEDAMATWRTRMSLNKLSMSSNSWVGMDMSEELQNISVSFSGIPETMDRSMLEVSAAVGWPATKMWGRSPAGMNATGEGDAEEWDAVIGSLWDDKIEPLLERLVEVVMSAKEGPTGGVVPESWRIVRNPLRELTEREQAEVRKLDSETAANYIADEVWEPDEVAVGRFGKQGYQSDFAIDLERRRERIEARAKIDAETELEQEAALAEAAKKALAGGGGDNDEGAEGDGDKPPGKPAPGKPPGDKGDEA